MSFSVTPVSRTEGQAGTATAFTFTVTDQNYQDGDTVYYQTVDGTATVADGDYVATSGLLTFSGGTSVLTFDVMVEGDNKFEADESFYVNLYQQAATTTTVAATSTVTSSTTTTVTATPVTSTTTTTVTATPVTVTTTATTTVFSPLPTATSDTNIYSEGSPTTANSNYVRLAEPAQSTDGPQTAGAATTAPAGYTLLAAVGTATILNDDPAPAFSITAGPNVVEGDQLVFTVTRTNDAQDPETVTVRTSDGTASQGRDYAANAQALTFTQGQLTQTFTVQTNRDGLYEGSTPETVNATLSLPTGGAALAANGSTATGGIVDGDPAPTLALSPATLARPEGNAGETDYVYTVTRTGDAQDPQTVSYGVAGSGTDQANANDFVGAALPSGTLTFAMGQTAQTLTVRVAGDATPEPDETFTIALGTPNFGTVTTGSASGTIIDDDTAATPTPTPIPTPTPTPAPGTVSFDDQVFYKAGTFTLSGRVSGVASLEISALVDGVRTDLGAATVNGDGTFTFSDMIGRHTQGFITATGTDATGGSVSAQAAYSLTGGRRGAIQDRYSDDGSAVVATDRFKNDGSQTATLFAPGGETFETSFFDTFDNGGAPLSTFVFDPGGGRTTVNGFRVDGTDHDTLSFKGSDFGDDVATVLNNSADVQGGLLITDPTPSSPGPGGNDTILLKGITKEQLAQNQGDITFHG